MIAARAQPLPLLRSTDRDLTEDPEVAEHVPQHDEYQDGAEAATAELFGSPASRYASQELAHEPSLSTARANYSEGRISGNQASPSERIRHLRDEVPRRDVGSRDGTGSASVVVMLTESVLVQPAARPARELIRTLIAESCVTESRASAGSYDIKLCASGAPLRA